MMDCEKKTGAELFGAVTVFGKPCDHGPPTKLGSAVAWCIALTAAGLLLVYLCGCQQQPVTSCTFSRSYEQATRFVSYQQGILSPCVAYWPHDACTATAAFDLGSKRFPAWFRDDGTFL